MALILPAAILPDSSPQRGWSAPFLGSLGSSRLGSGRACFTAPLTGTEAAAFLIALCSGATRKCFCYSEGTLSRAACGILSGGPRLLIPSPTSKAFQHRMTENHKTPHLRGDSALMHPSHDPGGTVRRVSPP